MEILWTAKPLYTLSNQATILDIMSPTLIVPQPQCPNLIPSQVATWGKVKKAALRARELYDDLNSISHPTFFGGSLNSYWWSSSMSASNSCRALVEIKISIRELTTEHEKKIRLIKNNPVPSVLAPNIMQEMLNPQHKMDSAPHACMVRISATRWRKFWICLRVLLEWLERYSLCSDRISWARAKNRLV